MGHGVWQMALISAPTPSAAALYKEQPTYVHLDVRHVFRLSRAEAILCRLSEAVIVTCR